MTARDKFYCRYFNNSPVERIFNKRIINIELLEWSTDHAKKLYSAISGKDRPAESSRHFKNIGHLAGLSPQGLRNAMGSIRFTALYLWSYAVFFSHNMEGRFPRNEYELLGFVLSLILQLEKGKGSVLGAEEGVSFLRKLAWKAYLKGNHGYMWNITSDDISETIEQDYPWLKEKKSQLFFGLGHMPLIEYNSKTGNFVIDKHMTEFLMGGFFLDTILSGNREQIIGLFRKGLTHQCQIYFNQGLELMDDKQGSKYMAVIRDVFHTVNKAREKDTSFELDVACAAIFQPLGFIKNDEAGVFLRNALRHVNRVTEFVRQSVAIGLAYSGDTKALMQYIQRLISNKKAGGFNRTFYLYYMRSHKANKNIEDYDEKQILQWDPLCDWLLSAMLTREFIPLRPLHLFTMADFIQKKGSSPFLDCGEVSQERISRLNEVLRALERDANVMKEKQCRNFMEILRKVAVKKGDGKCINHK